MARTQMVVLVFAFSMVGVGCGDDDGAACASDEFECMQTGQCIPAMQRCDGVIQCADTSDEALCNCNTATEFECYSGYCISSGSRCDGTPDCPGGEDEVGCGAGMTLEQYCIAEAALEQAWCDYLDQCCDASDRGADTFLAPFCNYGPDDPQSCIDSRNELIAAGRIVWNGTTAQACLSAQAAFIHAPPATCDGLLVAEYQEMNRDRAYRMQIPECKQTLVGQRSQGEECVGIIDCAEGLSCQGSSAPYTCQPQSSAYGWCSMTTDCHAGLVCYENTCGDLQAYGQSCQIDADCQKGLRCGTGTCVTPAPAGGGCPSGTDYECAYGTICDWNSSTCVPYGTTGATCGSDYECIGRCESSTCVALCGGTWF